MFTATFSSCASVPTLSSNGDKPTQGEDDKAGQRHAPHHNNLERSERVDVVTSRLEPGLWFYGFFFVPVSSMVGESCLSGGVRRSPLYHRCPAPSDLGLADRAKPRLLGHRDGLPERGC